MQKLNTTLPDSPGVYFFKKGRVILYIGKATSLRSRVGSYFNKEVVNTRGPFIVDMVDAATSVSSRKTDSVLEALILEAELIKRYQPKYNLREKDDRSYFNVVITKEDYSRVLQVRGRHLLTGQQNYKIKKLFGPFPSSVELKEAMRILRKLFPFRDKCSPNSGRPCFNRQIGLCPGVCTGEISKEEYAKQIKNIMLFLSGKKMAVVRFLKKEMANLAENQEFEKADEIKRKIFALEHIQDVSLMKRDVLRRGLRIEAYDVAHQNGENNVGVMVVVENGEVNKGEYRKFKIRGDFPADDLRSLHEVLDRRLNHPEWCFPDIIVVDGGALQVAVAEKILKRDGLKIAVVGVVKNEYHRPKNILGDTDVIKKNEPAILLANSEAHNFAINYFRKLANKIRF